MVCMLRPATIADAELLFRWRNDPVTRAASHETGELVFELHVDWLRRSLASDTRRIYIAELDGQPVGTVRADHAEQIELSWTVAPDHRGRGIGKQIVSLAMSTVGGPVRAEIKRSNAASLRIAEAVGMRECFEHDGVVHFLG